MARKIWRKFIPESPCYGASFCFRYLGRYPGYKQKVIGAQELVKFVNVGAVYLPKNSAATSDRVAPLATAPASAFAAGPDRFLDFMPSITGPAWGVAGMSGNEQF